MKHRVSICLTDLGELVKQKHPAVNAGKNGKQYINLDIWLNDEPDKFGNDISIKAYNKDTKESVYVGNGKQYKPEQTGNKPNKLPF